MHDAILDLDATAQAELVRTKAISSRELVTASLDRINQLNPLLNAVIHRLDAKALDATDSVDLDAPFAGVPMLVKDGVCHTAGDPFHCGMRVLRDLGWTEPNDSDLALRFRAAGFVIVGKTNLPELAATVTTEPLAYGPTRNPWDLARSTGGSSGGSAAAVASGMVAVAHGNDMGGSIRIPASACGLVGLKPTRARTSLGPAFGEYWGMTTHEFVLVRSVRDAAAILDAISGPAVGDPYSAAPSAGSWAAAAAAAPSPLRIGIAALGTDVHADCRAAVDDTAVRLEQLRHAVEVIDTRWLNDPRVGAAVAVLFPAFLARDVERWSHRIGRQIELRELEPTNAAMVELGRIATAVQFQAAVEAAQSWSRDAAQHFVHDFDILVTPTMPDPPHLLGTPMALGAKITYTLPFNLTGQPAISLPVHVSDDGLPIGVQLVGAYGREDVLLALSEQLMQTIVPTAVRRAPVSVS